MHVTFCESNISPSVSTVDLAGEEDEILPKQKDSVDTENKVYEIIQDEGETEDITESSPDPETRLSPNTTEVTNVEVNPFNEEVPLPKPREWRFMDNYPHEFIIGETSQ
ncbi:hypothetical protein PIB30_063024 [Stylosanthes scabra]|uniref:Uncharacterized protein n=1 Tax=Stylosanthes scabra TaxID=79078 RepID=A0ABU6QKS6_9FABA|nr:hypothetical protein [Stylosanthes scabra]